MTRWPDEVSCPTCGARPGTGCVSVHGKKPCRKPHRQRVARALTPPQMRTRRQSRRRPGLPAGVRDAVHARSGGQCEAKSRVPTLVCRGRLQHHHILRRAQGGADTVENLLHVCGGHHGLIHDQPEMSYRLGLLARRSAVAS